MTKLAEAIDAHKAGDFNKAERLYRRAIDNGKNLANAKHMLGVLRFQCGQLEDARRLIRQSLAINPKDDAAHYHHGVVLSAMKLHEDAIESFTKAIVLNPDNAGAYNNRGVAMHALGRHDEALNDFSKAIELVPDMVEAFYNSGNAYAALGKFEQAVTAFDCAIEREPKYADAHLNRGNALRALGRNDEALEAYATALRCDPSLIDAWVNRGNTLSDLKRYEDANSSYDQALAIDDKHVGGWLGRGNALLQMHLIEPALTAYQRVVSLNPASVDGWLGCGNALYELNRDAEAVECYDKVLALKLDHAEAHFNRGLVKLAGGDYAEGWREYEWRWQMPSWRRFIRDYQPLWRGDDGDDESDLSGKTIFIHAEQGMGDTIQIVRYLPLLMARGCRVILEAHKPLVPLFRDSGVEVIAQGDVPPRQSELPPFDFHCPLFSLPLAFKTTLDTIPAPPYLIAEDYKIAIWKALLGTRTKPRVGLVWSGNPSFHNDINRSIALEELLPWLVDSVEWFSLQKDVRDSDRDALARSPVRDLTDHFDDFADTAAMITQLDAVIAVDTAVAHLTGALGKPLWLLLPFHSDWRWLRDRTSSPWYPTAKLFQQRKSGDWSDVLARVWVEIEQLQ